MSFIRPRQERKKKTFVRKKPQWDDTVNDLNSYRATPDEIRHRHEAHKSKNHIAVRLEKLRKEKQKQRCGLSNVEARQVAIMKEVLHDQQQLDSVLTKSDHMLSLVKDLFGDDARKLTGHPNITMPTGNPQSINLPAAPEIHTRTEKLSESVMSQSALNDMCDNLTESDEEEEEGNPAVRFQPQLNLQRFQQFLHDEENRNSNAVPTLPSSTQADVHRLQQLQQLLLMQSSNTKDDIHMLSTITGNTSAFGGAGGSVQFSQATGGPTHSTCLLGNTVEGHQTPPNSGQTNSGGSPAPSQSALNDTGKVKKSRRKVMPPESALASGPSLNMTDMRQVLECLQAEIADFERKTGRRSDSSVQQSETFTGYTVTLVSAVTKLTHYMKETELRLQAEMMVREQLAQDVQQLTHTVDSLTQEVIVSQEESGKLASEFHRYRQQVQGEIAMLQAEVLELKHNRSAQGSNRSTPGKEALAGNEHEDENYTALPDHMTQPSAAVLLSPVVRKTRVHEDVQSDKPKPKQQTSLVDIPNLAEDYPHRQAVQQTTTTVVTVASSAAGQSDPPHLTQSLPAVAMVSVPRPIPLVQSNVAVALPESRAVASKVQPQYQAEVYSTTSGKAGLTSSSRSLLSTSGIPTSGTDNNMETQIAELNRQHVQAQQRLQTLLVQQKRQHDQLQLLEDDMAGGVKMERKTEQSTATPHLAHGAVSPPVSPISRHSEHCSYQDPMQRLASMSREIKVAMPTVDLEVSAGSLNISL